MGIRLPSEITRYACLVLFPESLELAVWIVDDQNAPEVPQHALGVDELLARDADEGDGDIGQPNPIQIERRQAPGIGRLRHMPQRRVAQRAGGETRRLARRERSEEHTSEPQS